MYFFCPRYATRFIAWEQSSIPNSPRRWQRHYRIDRRTTPSPPRITAKQVVFLDFRLRPPLSDVRPAVHTALFEEHPQTMRPQASGHAAAKRSTRSIRRSAMWNTSWLRPFILIGARSWSTSTPLQSVGTRACLQS